MYLVRDFFKRDKSIRRRSAMFYDIGSEAQEETLDLSSKTHVGKSTFYRGGVSKKSRERLHKPSIIVPAITWSEADDVIQSGTLERLKSNDEKVLQERKFEIITSELNYLNYLNILCTLYYKSTLSDFCARAEWQILFGNILEVKSVAESLLNDLVAHWERDVMLTGIYGILRAHTESSLAVLEDYCENLPLALHVFERLMADNGSFESEVKEINSSHGMCFHYLLVRPMVRVTRMPLLLENVLKLLPEGSIEHIECKMTLDSLRRVVNCCDEASR